MTGFLYRTIKSLHDELRWLYNRIMEQKEPGFRWDYAVISSKDKIFPSKNLLGYWGKAKGDKKDSTAAFALLLPQVGFIF